MSWRTKIKQDIKEESDFRLSVEIDMEEPLDNEESTCPVCGCDMDFNEYNCPHCNTEQFQDLL